MNRKKILIIAITILAVGLAGAAAFVKFGPPKNSQPLSLFDDKNPITEADQKEDNQQNNDASPAPAPPPQPAPTNQANPTSKQKVYPIVSTSSQTATSVIARVYMENKSSATCLISFKKNGYADVQRSVSTMLQVDRSVCQGFDIPKTDFPAKGEWVFSVRIFSDTVEGTSDPTPINIE